MQCSCGETQRHVICTRQTFDGLTVQLWSDGTFGSRFSTIPGLPHRRRKAPDMSKLWSFMERVPLLEADELADAFLKATEPRASKAPQYRPRWEVTRTDSRGCVTERRASLPRLMFPGGYVIFDEPGTRERYSLWHTETTNTGFYAPAIRPSPHLVRDAGFRRLRDLFAHLEAERELNRGRS